MTLEDLIGALTTALNDNTAELQKITGTMKANAKAEVAKEEPKPEPVKVEEPEEAPKKRGRPAKAETPKEEAPAKPAKAAKAPTDKEMADATLKFTDVDDETEYQNRREFVKKIIKHFGAAKMSLIEEDQRQKALDMLEAYKAGDDPFEGEEEDLA